MIDFVLSTTKQKKLSYVGYSQGTSQFFVMASTKPKYQDKVNFMVALAPIAYMDHASHPLLPLAKKIFPFIQVNIDIYLIYIFFVETFDKENIDTKVFKAGMYFIVS